MFSLRGKNGKNELLGYLGKIGEKKSHVVLSKFR